jgi:uncharacterized protein with NRDE domain
MCLAVIAWNAHPRYRLVVAANRDEFYERPAAAAAAWPEAPQLFAGRDMQAGGAWFGVDRQRRFGLVTNFRDLARPHPSAPSRGKFIPDFLIGAESAEDFLRRVEVDAPAYAGFSLLLADASGLWYASNRAEQFARPLPAGIYGLSNHLLDTPWPKLLRVRAGLGDWLGRMDAPDPATAADIDTLFTLLADRRQSATAAELHSELPPEWAAALSSPFVNHGGYGTRCSTLLLITDSGELQFRERRFDAQGEPMGDSELRLDSGVM